jgi:hypothetical protein
MDESTENRVNFFVSLKSLTKCFKQMRQERIVENRRCFDIRNAVTTSALIDDVEHLLCLRHFSANKTVSAIP